MAGEVLKEVEKASGIGSLKAYRMLSEARPPGRLTGLDRALKDVLGRRRATVCAVVCAADYGLLLYMVQQLSSLEPGELRGEAETLEGMLREALERDVEAGDGTVIVSHAYSLNTPLVLDTVYMLHLLAAIAERAGELAEHIEGYTMVDVDKIEKYAREVGVKNPAWALLAREIHDVKKRVELYAAVAGEPTQPTPYAMVYEALESRALSLLDENNREKLLRELREKAERSRCDIDRRNFYAHAGLERNAVAVAVREGRILVGYHPDCLRELREQGEP